MEKMMITEITEDMLLTLTLTFGGDNELVLNFCILIDTCDDFELIDRTFREIMTTYR